MSVHSPTFQCQLIEKKFRPITFKVWVLGRVEKRPEKGSENEKKIFVFVLNKYQRVTHASITIFQRNFKFLDM